MYNIYNFYSIDLNINVFVATKEINHFIKNCDNDNIIKILNTKYIYQLVFLNIQKNQINDRIDEVKNNKIKLTENIIKCKNITDGIERKRVGDENEIELKPIIENVFNLKLTKPHGEYSVFDFYADNCLVELKSNFRICHNVFIGTNKLICKNMLFIFKCNTTKDLYYLQYDDNIFNKIEIITPQLSSKTLLKKYYSIPKTYLVKFNKTDKITLDFLHDDKTEGFIMASL